MKTIIVLAAIIAGTASALENVKEHFQATTSTHFAQIEQAGLKKGGLIYLEGSIRARKWQKDGQDQYTTEIVASEMKMLGSKNGFASALPASTPNNHSTGNNASQIDDLFEEDDIPF